VLRQLKREVDEDNRLRNLMLPVQENIKEFEQKLLKAVEEALQVAFNLPNSFVTKEKVAQMQEALSKVIDSNWGSFVAANKTTFVDQENPEKNYLQLNYAHKNDPLILTLHKGQIERRTGVLSKYSPKFFVLTECKYKIS
jgi:putative cell wall-binding protein